MQGIEIGLWRFLLVICSVGNKGGTGCCGMDFFGVD